MTENPSPQADPIAPAMPAETAAPTAIPDLPASPVPVGADSAPAATPEPPATPLPPALSVVKVAHRAKLQLSQITGLEAATVSAIEAHEGGWKAYVNLVELRRVPSTSDVLATYEAILDANAELLNYRRIRRFLRGQVNDN